MLVGVIGNTTDFDSVILGSNPRPVTKPKIKNMSETFSFGEAIAFLKKGFRVARLGWNGVGIFLELQVPDEHSKMTSPYIYIDTTELNTQNPNAPKTRVPWLASQTDMLTDDWYVIVGAIQA